MRPAGSTYTQVARADAEARTREALLDAAETTFFEADWNRSSLVSIADRAGVTKQTLLRHFESKDGLLRAAYGRAFSRVEEQRLAAPQDDIAGAVSNLLDHYYELGDRARKLGTIDESALGLDVGTRARKLHHDWIDHAFGAAIGRVAEPRREEVRRSLIVVCDVQSWAILVHDMNLPRAEVQKTLEYAINQLLGSAK
jgi:AcrR family transcriptional regulator